VGVLRRPHSRAHVVSCSCSWGTVSGRASSSPRAGGPRRRVALPPHPALPMNGSARAWSAERRSSAALARRGARLFRRARLPALHVRLFVSPGPCFRARTGPEPGPRSGQLSPPFVRAASSHSRQALVVGPDGDPGPPGSGVTSLASGRRPSPACRHVCRQAPRVGEVRRNMVLDYGRNMVLAAAR
jgi:hypothetical protein